VLQTIAKVATSPEVYTLVQQPVTSSQTAIIVGNNVTSFRTREMMSYINFTMYLSEIPTALHERLEYFDNLVKAIRSILNLSRDWFINRSEENSSTERRLGLSRNGVVNLAFSNSFADPADFSDLQSKLNDQKFFDQLNILGFKASRVSFQSTETSNQGPMPLFVGLFSAAGFLTGFCFLFCLARHFCISARDMSKGSIQPVLIQNTKLSKSQFQVQHDHECHREKTGGTNGFEGSPSESESSESNSNFARTGMKSIPDREERHGINEENQIDYSKEFEEVLQLIVGLGISIESFVEPQLRKDVEEIIKSLNEITAQDHSSDLCLKHRLQYSKKRSVDTSMADEKQMTQHRIIEGPFKEVHLHIFQLICESEIRNRSTEIIEENPHVFSTSEESAKIKQKPTSNVKIEIVEEQDVCDKPLCDVLRLLKTCDLEPSYLLQKESRKLIEDNLTCRQGPLLEEHLAVLQLLSKAEIDSDTSIDSMRKHLLKKRIKEGPLNADHLYAVQFLSKFENIALNSMSWLDPWTIVGTKVQQKPELEQVLKSQHNHYETCELTNAACASAVLSRDIPVVHESEPNVFVDTIPGCGIDVRISILSKKEKSDLQLMELRAKTASIRQSLPDWVRNSLVPPQQNPSPCQLLPQYNVRVLAEELTKNTDYHVGREAILISCDVRADIGFLSDFLQPARAAPPKMMKKVPTSVLIDVEQGSEITANNPKTSLGWQEELLAVQDLRQSPEPQLSLLTRIGAVLSRIFYTLAQCMICCQQAVLSTLCPSCPQKL
jgi:hypothetical protein